MNEITHTEERYYDYKNIRCIIKKRKSYEQNYIYNTYIVIGQKRNKELFDRYILEQKEYKIIDSSPIRYIYEYENLDIPFSGGITFYERVFNQNAECIGIKIGNDYNHIWNGGETFETVRKDLECVVDFILDNPTKEGVVQI